MIEEFLCLRARPWASAKANALFDRAIDQFFLRRCGKYQIERFVGRRFIDLLEPQVAPKPLPANRPLLHSQRRVALGEPRVVKIAVLAQTLNHRLDDCFGCAPTLQQTFAQFFDRTWPRSEQLGCAMKDTFASLFGIEATRYLSVVMIR